MRTDWLITGAGGQLGSVLFRELIHSRESAVGTLFTGGSDLGMGPTVRLDLTDFDALRRLVQDAKPRFIVHTAAVTSIDVAWRNPDQARWTNVEVTAELASMAVKTGSRFLFLSTDLVFDGSAAPYRETDAPTPLSVYGRTKAEAEKAVLLHSNSVVIRPALMYGLPAIERPTTFRSQLEALRNGQPLKMFEDEYRTPLWLEDAARACIEAAKSDFTGLLHVAGPERLSRLEMGRLMAQALGIRGDNIVSTRQRDMQTPEPRPADVSLDCGLFAQHFGHPPGRRMADVIAEIFTTM